MPDFNDEGAKMLKPNKQIYTAEEYFDMEKLSEYKSEYFYGEIFAMAGGTPNHNRITINLAGTLNAAFKDKFCEAFASDLRVQVEKGRHYTYPDVVVVCGELEFAEKRKDTIINPVIIMEVLSDSTKDYDRGTKFTVYRNIKTLQDYILIDQDIVHIEYFSKKEDGTWRLQEYFNMEEVLTLESIQVKISIKEIYNRVSLIPKLHLLRA
ncbi:MAG: Uma2 family endonuclease [bacterium]|nr:Uma2 family endonuclease [bacterium]